MQPSDSIVDAQTVGVLVTAASVTIAAIYYVMNLRITQKNQELGKSQETSVALARYWESSGSLTTLPK